MLCSISYVYRKPLNRRWVMNRNEHICNVHFNVSQLSASKSLFIVEKMKLSSKIRRRLCWCLHVRERYIETSAVIFIPIVVGFLFFPQLQTTSAAESRPITKTTSSFFDQSINKVLVIVPLAAIKMSNLDNFRWWAWTWDGCVLFIQCKRNQRKLNWVREIYIPVEQVKAWNSNKEMFSNGEDDAWWQWITSNSNLKSWVVTIVIQIKIDLEI